MVDFGENHIRRVGPHGIITTLAGPVAGDLDENTPPAQFGGDRCPAIQARLFAPRGLALAPDGSLYVADRGNNRIRRISSALPGVAGLGDLVVAAPSGRQLYVFDDRGQHKCTTDAFTYIIGPYGQPVGAGTPTPGWPAPVGSLEPSKSDRLLGEWKTGNRKQETQNGQMGLARR